MSERAYGRDDAASANRGEIDLSALMREVGRRKWLVLAATLAAAVLSTVAVSVMKPRYTAETRILVENRETDYTRFGRDSARGSDPAIDQEQVMSQVQLLTSRDLARRMIERFDLGSKREFDPVIDGIGVPTRILVMLGLVDNPANVSPQERVLESYYDKLKAFALTRSRVLSVEFQSRDPELAANLSNAIAEEYILQLESAKKGTAQTAGSWLQRTIEPLRQRVAQAEARVEAFRSQNGLYQSGENTTISVQQLSELNTQLATARAQQAELSAKARIIREAVRQGRIFEVSDVANNEVVRRLIESRATLKAQIAQEERTLLPQHPRIRELYAQLGGLEEQVRAAADRAARALENDSRAAGARVAASQAELDQQKGRTGTASEAEVQLRVLEREAKAEREQLEGYLARYRDASVRDIENAVAADARIVSRATVPSAPTFPKRLPIIIIATLAAFTISLFLVLTRALLSDAIYTVRTAPAAPAPQMAGMVPFPMIPPQVLQAYYAQQAQMMAQMMPPPAAPMPAAPQPAQDVHAAAAAEAPAARPPAPQDHPAPQAAPDTPDALRRSLNRLRESIQAVTEPRKAAPPASVLPAAPVSVMPNAPVPQPVAVAATPEPPPVLRPVLTDEILPVRIPKETPPAEPVPMPAPVLRAAPPVETAPAMPVPATVIVAAPAPAVQMPEPIVAIVEDAPALDGGGETYDALAEVADEAQASLIRGRPVSILVLSALDAGQAASAAAALVRKLKAKGSVVDMALDPSARTPDHLTGVVRNFSGTHDYVVLSAGQADSHSAGLSRKSALTVLVAPEDILDPRSDAAAQQLSGCNYFIVGPVSADAMA